MTHMRFSILGARRGLVVLGVGVIIGAVLGCGAEFEPEIPVVGAEVNIRPSGADARPGDARVVEVLVRNTGNVSHDFTINATLTTPAGERVMLDNRSLRLAPGEEGVGAWRHTFAYEGDWRLEAAVIGSDSAELDREPVQDFLHVGPCTGVDVYRVWVTGHPTGECELLGIRMLWWGRIGQLLALGSIVALFAEFRGSARLRQAGASLRAVEIPRALGWITSIYRKRRRVGFGLGITTIVVFVVFASLTSFTSVTGNPDAGANLYIALVFTGYLMVFVALVVLVAPAVFAGVLILADWMIIKPFAVLLDKGELGLKTLSVIILLAGLHFTVLAS